MGTIRAFTTVQAETGDGGADQPTVSVVASPNVFASASDVCYLYVFTDPTSYLDTVVKTSTDGHITGGGFESVPMEEDVDLTNSSSGATPAEGNLRNPLYPATSMVQTCYGYIGGSANNILVGNEGSSKIQTRAACYAWTGHVTYTSRCKKYEISGMTKPKVTIEVDIVT